MTTHRLCKGCGNQECAIAGKDGAAYCDSFIPATNADRIRAMSDEELAEFMRWDVCGKVRGDNRKCYGDCSDCALEWLQQPAEED